MNESVFLASSKTYLVREDWHGQGSDFLLVAFGQSLSEDVFVVGFPKKEIQAQKHSFLCDF